MAKSLTLQTVISACRSITNAWQRWKSQDGPVRAFNGVMMKVISQEVDEAIKAGVDGTADENCDVAPDARRLQMLLDDIGNAYRKWFQDLSLSLSSARATGSDALENAIQALTEALAVRKLPAPEPVSALMARHAAPQTIAMKYGWLDEDGAPDVQKVHDELEAPGTHFDPKTWVHPSERRAQREVEAKWATREKRPVLFPDLEGKSIPKPKLRPIEEMIQALAPPQQIANVYKLTVEEVLEIATDLGVDLTAPRYVKPINEVAMHEEAMKQEEERAAAAAAATAKSQPEKVTA